MMTTDLHYNRYFPWLCHSGDLYNHINSVRRYYLWIMEFQKSDHFAQQHLLYLLVSINIQTENYCHMLCSFWMTGWSNLLLHTIPKTLCWCFIDHWILFENKILPTQCLFFIQDACMYIVNRRCWCFIQLVIVLINRIHIRTLTQLYSINKSQQCITTTWVYVRSELVL